MRPCNPRKAKALLYQGVTITKRGGRFWYEPDEAKRVLRPAVQRPNAVR